MFFEPPCVFQHGKEKMGPRSAGSIPFGTLQEGSKKTNRDPAGQTHKTSYPIITYKRKTGETKKQQQQQKMASRLDRGQHFTKGKNQTTIVKWVTNRSRPSWDRGELLISSFFSWPWVLNSTNHRIKIRDDIHYHAFAIEQKRLEFIIVLFPAK